MQGTMSRVRRRLERQGREVARGWLLFVNKWGESSYRRVADLGRQEQLSEVDELLDKFAADNPSVQWVSFDPRRLQESLIRHTSAEQGLSCVRNDARRILYCLATVDDGIRYDDDNRPKRVGQVYPVKEFCSATLGLHATIQANFSRSLDSRLLARKAAKAEQRKQGEQEARKAWDACQLTPNALESDDKPTIATVPSKPREPKQAKPVWPVWHVYGNATPVGCKYRLTGKVLHGMRCVDDNGKPVTVPPLPIWGNTVCRFTGSSVASRLPIGPSGVPTCYVERKADAYNRPVCKPGQRFA